MLLIISIVAILSLVGRHQEKANAENLGATTTEPVRIDATSTPIYKVLDTYEEKTVKTIVEYTFNIDGQEVKKEVVISHFMPKDQEEINLGIENRYQTEYQKLLNHEE